MRDRDKGRRHKHDPELFGTSKYLHIFCVAMAECLQDTWGTDEDEPPQDAFETDHDSSAKVEEGPQKKPAARKTLARKQRTLMHAKEPAVAEQHFETSDDELQTQTPSNTRRKKRLARGEPAAGLPVTSGAFAYAHWLAASKN